MIISLYMAAMLNIHSHFLSMFCDLYVSSWWVSIKIIQHIIAIYGKNYSKMLSPQFLYF